VRHLVSRRAAIAALVVPALVLVAMTARSYQPFGGEPGGERDPSTAFLDAAFTLVLGLSGAVLLLILFWVWRVGVRRSGKTDDPPLWPGIVMLVVVVTVSVTARQLLGEDPRPPAAGGSVTAFPQQVQRVQPVTRREEPSSPPLIWPLAFGLAVFITAAIVAAIVIERRRDRREPRTSAALEELGRALDEAIDDLRRDPDPRRAVIAAYARMEQALTVYGLPRKPAEAPYEYLHRVARELEAEGPVAALTELFEEAKFSEHSVDEAMRGRAIDALVSVRREVQAAT
jgi:hypothetical protein